MSRAIHLLGEKNAKSSGSEFWPPVCSLNYSESDFYLEFPFWQSALSISRNEPTGDLYPFGLTTAQMHEFNFRVRRIAMSGIETPPAAGFVSDRHSMEGATYPFPQDGQEQLLAGWPGCAIYSEQPSVPAKIGINIGFPMLFVTQGNLLGGYIAHPNGLTFPVLCDAEIYPTFSTYVPVIGSNFLTNPAACIFYGGNHYPFIRAEWESPSSLFSTVEYEGATGNSRNTGYRLHFFDWGSVPIYEYYVGGSPTPLENDVFITTQEWFSYSGLYSTSTGKALKPIPTNMLEASPVIAADL